ncbi:Hsp20 family protein [Pantoea sp. GD03673]|uniref:Hsp20 family protein n=1 Tax=Pantoea sp. GD03673 TaxID=2975364 RepID=UPI00326450D0
MRRNEFRASSGEARQENSDGIHRGLSRHNFPRRFYVPSHMKVTGASLAQGLLSTDLIQERSESAKPRRISLAVGGP